MASPESKTNFASLRDKILSQNGKEYWRSIEEHADTPEFRKVIAEEYPHEIEEWDNSLSRRNFVKVMGASLALAGLSGCVIQPPEKIVPYVTNTDGMLPGRPLFVATAMTLGGIAMGVLAKSYDGRPIKIEGNPQHPNSRGATDARAQASLLGMYDPDRSQEVTYRGAPKTWEAFIQAFRAGVEENRANGGAGIRFLSETVTSPTLIDQFTRLKAELPNSKWIQYEPVNNDNVMAGARMAFGSPVQTVYKYDAADRILSLDADIFSSFNVGYMKDYVAGKEYSNGRKEINRLYSVETSISLTGAKADHRIAVKPSQMIEIAKAVAIAVGVSGVTSTYTENAQWIAAMARDLVAHRGRSIVVPGDNQSPEVHALAHAINGALGNAGQTVLYIDPLSPGNERSQMDQLRELIAEIDSGVVKMLVILGGNPLYSTPIDVKLNAERMAKVPLRVHLGLYSDETSEHCHWHVSEKHFLESWSDCRTYDGTATVIQPLIAPLYQSKNAHQVVQLAFRENFDRSDYDIVKEFWQRQNISSSSSTPATAGTPNAAPVQPNSGTAGSPTSAGTTARASTPAPAAARNFEDNWRKALHDGVVPNTAATPRSMTASTGFLAQTPPRPAANGSLEISILPDPSIFDGRFANNGWLQELPKPLNKVTWENVALISPATAARLGVNAGNDAREYTGGSQGSSFINTKGGNQFSDLATLSYQGAAINKPVPMWITPGQPDEVVTIFMGYGRNRAGRVGTGVGYNAFDVRASSAMDHGFGDIALTGAQTEIASTQIHFNMEGRDLLRVWNVDELAASNGLHEPDMYPKSMYPYEQHQAVYERNYKWGMTIDLNSCVGCNACVVACQAENNIPVVGKEQVNRSREMHWLRIDTYYGGTDINHPDGPHFQPVLCMQCEQAPCEVVCPVHATVHSAEGLNDMVYNRCVGTRYCSNNCPYKVRRFNFLLYQDWNTPQYKLMRNPEVTVRSRGVMEKCTYCTQRISAARIEAEKDGRLIRDGEVVTACQAVCPTDAIVFGDLHDPQSAVSKLRSANEGRDYRMLNAELNTQPRTSYLAALKNSNREMPDHKERHLKADSHGETKSNGGEGH